MIQIACNDTKLKWLAQKRRANVSMPDVFQTLIIFKVSSWSNLLIIMELRNLDINCIKVTNT